MKYALMTAIVLSGLMTAQPMRGPGGGPRIAGPGKPHYSGWQERDHPGPKSKKQMEMMIMWRLTEELELSEEQASIFFPKFKKHRDEMEQIMDQLRELGADIKSKLDEEKEISDKYLKNTLGKITTLEQRKVDARKTFLNSMSGTLTNEQILKLSVFEQRFKGEIKKRMRKERHEFPREGRGQL